MQPIDFEQVIERIVELDSRFTRDAYLFLREALDHTQKSISRQQRAAKGATASHVTGGQLLDGIRDYALQQFGPMAKTVLAEWGITRCEDFGEIVFNMVDHGLLGKTEKDSREDFKGGYTFQEAFVKPFQPANRKKSDRPAIGSEKRRSSS